MWEKTCISGVQGEEDTRRKPHQSKKKVFGKKKKFGKWGQCGGGKQGFGQKKKKKTVLTGERKGLRQKTTTEEKLRRRGDLAKGGGKVDAKKKGKYLKPTQNGTINGKKRNGIKKKKRGQLKRGKIFMEKMLTKKTTAYGEKK